MHILAELPYFSILVATAVGAAIGALWYSPAMLLGAWTKANGAPPTADGPAFATMTAAGFIGAFAVALLALLAGQETTAHSGLHLGLIAGIGVAGASVAMNAAFRAGRWTIALVDGGFHVVRFAVYGLIIGWWPW